MARGGRRAFGVGTPPGYLDYAIGAIATGVVPQTAVSAATSIDIPGLTLDFIQPAYPVEAMLEGEVLFNDVSLSALTKTGVTVCWLDDAGVVKGDKVVRWTFYVSGGGASQILVPFKVRYLSQDPPGTEVHLRNGIYLSVGAAATWSANVFPSPTAPAIAYAKALN